MSCKENTAKVLSMFEDKVEKNHEVERINITQYKVGGCLGCYKCKEKKSEPGCVQKDDALTIFEKMIQADAIVYASPLYCWSFTSQIKLPQNTFHTSIEYQCTKVVLFRGK